MSLLIYAALFLLGSILIPVGLMLGTYLVFKLILWRLDRALDDRNAHDKNDNNFIA